MCPRIGLRYCDETDLLDKRNQPVVRKKVALCHGRTAACMCTLAVLGRLVRGRVASLKSLVAGGWATLFGGLAVENVQRPTVAEVLDIHSVVVVGVSAKMGYYWAHSVLQWPHDLKVWLVARRGGEVLGHRVLTDISDVPEKVDYAIVSVPYRAVPDVLRACAKLGARGATIFTSGYSELGTPEGRAREQGLTALVRSLPMRVFGPNCMGICYPERGLAFMPTVKRSPGHTAFVSQSGGVAISVYTAGAESGLGFSKLFSFGNGIDIRPPELFDYLRDDSETHVVGAYLEGTRDGKALYRALWTLAHEKPVVLLKGGRSKEGSRVASSHTGALAGTPDIWLAALRQANVAVVETLEDMVATLSVFAKCPPPQSRSVGIMSISGGTSVVYTDLCTEHGLSVPRTPASTREALDPLVRDVGTSLNNPIDLAADYYSDTTIADVIRTVGGCEAFSSLMLEADVHHIYQVSSIMDATDTVSDFWWAMASAGKGGVEQHAKPVLAVVPDVAYPAARKEAWDIFVEAGLPVFRNFREAVGALARVCAYYETKQARASTACR